MNGRNNSRILVIFFFFNISILPSSLSLSKEKISYKNNPSQSEKEIEDNYSFESVMPDPFIPPNPRYHIAKIEIPITSILQQYSIESLSLGGIWKKKDQSLRALILTPKRQGVTVKVGDPIGGGGGVVHEILKSSLIVREFSLDSDLNRKFFDREIIYRSLDEKKSEKKVIIIKPKDPSFLFEKEKEKEKEKE